MSGKNKDEKYNKIRDKKKSTTLEELCKGLPEGFLKYLKYCRGLKFDEKPDYNLCRQFFKDMLYQNGYEYDYQFDWVLKKAGQKIPVNPQPR